MSFANVLAAIQRPQVLAGMDRMQPEMRAIATSLLERFAARRDEPIAIPHEGAALALWGFHWQHDKTTAFLAWHQQLGGLSRALEVLLAAIGFERRSYEWDNSIWALARARPASGLANLGVRPWLWMRRALDAAPAAERDAAAAIADRASRAWHVRAALAFVFHADPTRWTDDDQHELRHADPDDATAVRFGVLAAMRGAKLDLDAIAGNYQIADAIPPRAMIEALGSAAVAPLRLIRAYPDLVATGDADGLRALLEMCDADASWETIAKLAPTAHAIAALAPLFTRQRPRRLLGLQLAHGFLAELVVAAPDEAAKVASLDGSIARLLAQSGASLPADDRWVSPWQKPDPKSKGKSKPGQAVDLVVVNEVTYDERIAWEAGQREERAQEHERDPDDELEIEKRVRSMSNVDRAFVCDLVWLSDATALALWKELEAKQWYAQVDDIEHLLARWGLAELDSIAAYVRFKPDTLPALARVDSPRVAPLMARGFALVKKMEKIGRAWLEAHPEAAAIGLLRDSGADKKQRDANAKALAHVAAKHPAIVEAVAAKLGTDAGAVVAAGAARLPPKPPKLPAFVDVARLPRPIRHDGSVALQGDALGEFVQLLAATLPGSQPALDDVAARYTEASLSRLAWSVFRQWLFAGAPPKHKWALYAVGRFPDDDNARALGRLARVWAPGGNSARAQEAVETLAAMRTQTGLIEIHDIASKVQSKALRARAETVFETVAKSLGLRIEELADRLVPEVSEADLTFGEQRVEIDDLLVPRLAENVRADNALRDAADLARWRELEKTCKTVARAQTARLEQLMADGQRMPYAHFSEIYLMHSLLRHLARSVLWGAYRGATLERTFAIAPDGPVDGEGKPIALSIDDDYGVVHPVELSADERAMWTRRIGVQPFEQLARTVFPAGSGAEVSLVLARWIGRMIPTAGLLELMRRGWRRGEAVQGGRYYTVERAGRGWSAELAFLPGIYLGNPLDEPTQTIESIAFFAEPTVPQAVLSEIQRDVRGLIR